jgi:hypothetical protein
VSFVFPCPRINIDTLRMPMRPYISEQCVDSSFSLTDTETVSVWIRELHLARPGLFNDLCIELLRNHINI